MLNILKIEIEAKAFSISETSAKNSTFNVKKLSTFVKARFEELSDEKLDENDYTQLFFIKARFVSMGSKVDDERKKAIFHPARKRRLLNIETSLFAL
jgi:hypothetical protein